MRPHRLQAFLAVLPLAGGCATSAARPHTIAREHILEEYMTERPERPGLVVDLDDTVVRGGFWGSLRLAFDPFYASMDPMPRAADCLRDLEKDWNIVFLTARDDIVLPQTLEWLDYNRFPRAPVVFASSIIFGHDERVEYKGRAIAALKARGLRVACGVGDKASDVGAYRTNDLATILIADGSSDEDLAAALREARGITTDPEAVPGNRDGGIELVVLDWNTAWDEVVAHLRARLLAAGGGAGGAAPAVP